MGYLPDDKSRPLNRFSIYSDISPVKKREAEAMELSSFLLGIDQVLEIHNVEYASDPPDFVFTIGDEKIGVELTTVNPALFGEGGNRKKKEFRDWSADADANLKQEHTFTWGTFTLRESLESLKHQFQLKCDKAARWTPELKKKWLLINLEEGGPFGDLVASRFTPAASTNPQLYEDHFAKVVFEVCAVFAGLSPFDYIFMYSGIAYVPFARNGQNPYRLPLPRWDVVARGARINDEHLSWKSTLRRTIRRRSWVSESEDTTIVRQVG